MLLFVGRRKGKRLGMDTFWSPLVAVAQGYIAPEQILPHM
jgi:hypothetical protein